MKRIVIAALVLMMGVIAVMAQDEDVPEGCDTETALMVIRGFTDDIEAGEHVVEDLIDVLLVYQSTCAGLAWNSDDEGMQPVIGPVTIPEGVYRVTALTDGYMIVQHEILEGECDDDFALFSVSPGQADEGAQKTFRSAGCEILIEISNTREAWALSFEKLR